jgi:hypothetical protein
VNQCAHESKLRDIQLSRVSKIEVSDIVCNANMCGEASPLQLLPELLCWLLGPLPGNSQVFGVKRLEGYLGILPLFIP